MCIQEICSRVYVCSAGWFVGCLCINITMLMFWELSSAYHPMPQLRPLSFIDECEFSMCILYLLRMHRNVPMIRIMTIIACRNGKHMLAISLLIFIRWLNKQKRNVHISFTFTVAIVVVIFTPSPHIFIITIWCTDSRGRIKFYDYGTILFHLRI